MMPSKSFAIFVCSAVMLIANGCSQAALPTIDTSSAEFASPDDYASYDHEMTRNSAGQDE